MGKKSLATIALLTGIVLLAYGGYGVWVYQNEGVPDPEARATAISDDLRFVLDQQEEIVVTTTTTTLLPVVPETSSSTTTPPPPQGDNPEEKIVCAAPVELTVSLSMAKNAAIPLTKIDVSDSRFDPAKNRLDLHISDVNGLPCVDSQLPVKILGHKQGPFCNLVVEPNDKCPYGVSLGDTALVELEDGTWLEYRVAATLDSEVAKTMAEVYSDFYEETGITPTPAMTFRKFEQYLPFYDEIFTREDAKDEMWLFTSCGEKKNGYSQDACAVRTVFVRMIVPEQRITGVGE